ncbi:MAG: hypothetical protein Kow00123_26350 [Anaerolineales bacterium]
MTQIRITNALDAARVPGATREVEVTLIRPGLSLNGWLWTPEVLAEAAPLFEGATALMDHAPPGQHPSVRQAVGAYHSVRATPDGLKARLAFLPSATDAWHLARDCVLARERGRPVPNVGISADVTVESRPVRYGGRPARLVERIAAVHSADIVLHPSAGGSLDRIAEAYDAARLELHRGDAEDAEVGTGQEEWHWRDAEDLEKGANEMENRTNESLNRQAEVHRGVAESAEGMAVFDSPRPGGESMPRPTGLEAAKPLAAREWTGAAPTVAMGLSPDDAVRAACYRAFGIAPEHWEPELRAAESRLGNGRVRPFLGLRDLYVHITGDYAIAGRFWARAQEAAMLTTDLPNLLADTLNKKLQVEYNHYPQDWRKWCSVVSIPSLSEQDSVQLDDLGALPEVAEGDPYTTAALDEFKASYTPHKYGELITITREMILRDDLRGLTRIPGKLAQAAALRLNDTVYGLVEDNTTIYDGLALFLGTSDRGAAGNLASGALDSDSLADALSKLRRVRGGANASPIVFRRVWLVVPPALELTAAQLCGSAYAWGGQEPPATGYNFFRQSGLDYIVAPWNDSQEKWWIVGDPADCAGLEIGFVQGVDSPQLFIQDDPRVGSVFTHDQISYKVRFEFGAGIVNWRPFVGYMGA